MTEKNKEELLENISVPRYLRAMLAVRVVGFALFVAHLHFSKSGICSEQMVWFCILGMLNSLALKVRNLDDVARCLIQTYFILNCQKKAVFRGGRLSCFDDTETVTFVVRNLQYVDAFLAVVATAMFFFEEYKVKKEMHKQAKIKEKTS